MEISSLLEDNNPSHRNAAVATVQKWERTGLKEISTSDLFIFFVRLPRRDPMPAVGMTTLNGIYLLSPIIIIIQSNYIIHFRCA